MFSSTSCSRIELIGADTSSHCMWYLSSCQCLCNWGPGPSLYRASRGNCSWFYDRNCRLSSCFFLEITHLPCECTRTIVILPRSKIQYSRIYMFRSPPEVFSWISSLAVGASLIINLAIICRRIGDPFCLTNAQLFLTLIHLGENTLHDDLSFENLGQWGMWWVFQEMASSISCSPYSQDVTRNCLY